MPCPWGVHHLPGDRVGVLAEHEDQLVRRTVTALQATGDELVPLTARWRTAVASREGYGEVDVLPLRTLLRFAQLRPDIRSYDTELAAMSARPDVTLVRQSVSTVKKLLAEDDFRRVTALCRTYAHADVQLLRDLKDAVLTGIRAFETHEADVVEQAGATLLNATRDTLAVVSAYYQRLAGQTRGHHITGDGAVEEPIPADRGLPGHGGPLLLPD
ncbi:hypothetical protein ACWKSP_40820 [Micromonosporaceae bacterium Da 78-11]